MNASQVWVVHSPVNIADKVQEKSVVAIGWHEVGRLDIFGNREELKAKFGNVFSNSTETQIAVGAGQLYRFVNEMHIGDYILTPLKVSREVLIGLIEGNYEQDPSVISDEYPNIRKVKWLKKISRDDLSQQFKYAIGGALTVFQVSDYLSEVENLLRQRKVASQVEETPDTTQEPASLIYEDIRAKSDELISDLIVQIDAYSFQDLVAGVLKTMGFRTRVSPRGRDQGVDIVAHPDAFGFETPKIKVQVKHRKGQAGSPEVRELRGTLAQNENGLFISTGGFTNEAYRESEKQGKITLMDRQQFVDLLIENYDNLQPEYQALVPLKRIYFPFAPTYTSTS